MQVKDAAVTVESPQPFRAVFARRSLIILVALLLAETTINFIDRQVVSVLAPTLRAEFHLSNGQYATILNAFMATYAVSYAFAGWGLDRLGVGRGLTLAVGWWSFAGMATSLASGPVSLGFFRSALALGEGGGWPAFAKAIATWVPPQARTLAIGVCNSGSSLGAMIAPPLVAWITIRFGWRYAFICTGALGLIWVAAFQTLPEFSIPRWRPPSARRSRQATRPLGGSPRLPPDVGAVRVPLPCRSALVLLCVLDSRNSSPASAA